MVCCVWVMSEELPRSASELVALAAKQHGLMTHVQASSAGYSRTAISRLVRSGVWEMVRPRVFRRAAASQTEGQALLAVCLWLKGDTLVSHRSAAKFLGLDVAAEKLEVTRSPLSPFKAPGVLVHRSRTVDAVDRKVVRGIPVTTGARTIIDLASCLPEDELAIVVEEARRRRIASPDWVERRLDQLDARGRRTALLSEILADCRARKAPLESALEVRVWRLIKRSKLPLPVAGYEFRDDFGQPGRIDFAYPEQNLAIEADGYEFHSDREAFERDRVRISRLAALGWRVMVLTRRQLDQQPRDVVERLRQALQFRSEEQPSRS